MAERLRDALADNALGGVLSKTGGRSPTEIVRELRDEWAGVGPGPGARGTELRRRFDDACGRALGGATDVEGGQE
jgi:hypothetical protein